MNIYYSTKNKYFSPYNKIPFEKHKYKIIDDKFNELKNNFKILLGDVNKDNEKKLEIKKKFRKSLNMSKIIEYLIFKKTKNSNNLIKTFNMKNYQKYYKKFMCSNEISSYKKRKNFFIKLLREKNINNNKINKTYIGRNKLDNLSNLNNRSNTLLSVKDTILDNKMSFTTKSLCSQISFKNNINIKDKNINKKSMIKIKQLKINNKRYNFKEKIFGKRNSNSSINLIKNHSSDCNSNMNEKEFDINNNDNNITFENNNESFINIYKKANLKNLKIKIDKFENSKNFLPNSDIIEKNSNEPYLFIRKKGLEKFEISNFYKNKKETNNTINKTKKYKRFYSVQKFKQKLNKTQTPSRKDVSKSNSNDNTKILIRKINSQLFFYKRY